MQSIKWAALPSATSSGHREAELTQSSLPTQDEVEDPASEVTSHESDQLSTRKGFLDLPYEIREMLYRLALVVDSDYTFVDTADMEAIWSAREEFHRKLHGGLFHSLAYADAWVTFHRPMLLAVSRLVHEEAAPIFHGQNTFCLPARMKPGEASHWKTYATCFRKVAVYLSSYDLVCGVPPSHTRKSFDEDDKVTDQAVAGLKLEHKHKCRDNNEVVAASVKGAERIREMLALLVNVEHVHIKIEGGTYVFVDLSAWRPLDAYRLPLRVLPYFKDWSEFMFGETRRDLPPTTLSKRRPVLTAQLDFWTSSQSKVVMSIHLKGGDVV